MIPTDMPLSQAIGELSGVIREPLTKELLLEMSDKAQKLERLAADPPPKGSERARALWKDWHDRNSVYIAALADDVDRLARIAEETAIRKDIRIKALEDEVERLATIAEGKDEEIKQLQATLRATLGYPRDSTQPKGSHE